MRFVLGLLAVLFVPSALSAQRPIVVLGCVTLSPGVLLRPLAGDPEHFDRRDLANPRAQFLLFADNDLLDEITLHEGNEIEVTGHLNPPGPEPSVKPPILQPPGGGNRRPLPEPTVQPPILQPPGGGNVFAGGTRSNPRTLNSPRPGGPIVEGVIVVEKFKAVRPGCRVRSRF